MARDHDEMGLLSNPITIHDDDDEDGDEVLIYSPNQSSPSSEALSPVDPIPSFASWVPDITQDLSQLQLGSITVHNGPSASNTDNRREKHLQTRTRDKTTFGLDSSCRQPSMELKLECIICLDTMKEETSTLCGHVFCCSCILAVIQAQGRCPTCRKVLSMADIHRIYLSLSPPSRPI